MSDHEERRCYATMRGTRLSLNDDLEPFEDGESLVIIAESEYERLKALEERAMRVSKQLDKALGFDEL